PLYAVTDVAGAARDLALGPASVDHLLRLSSMGDFLRSRLESSEQHEVDPTRSSVQLAKQALQVGTNEIQARNPVDECFPDNLGAVCALLPVRFGRRGRRLGRGSRQLGVRGLSRLFQLGQALTPAILPCMDIAQ